MSDEDNFEELIADYLQNNIGISLNFLGDANCQNLISNLKDLYANQHLQDAKTGKGQKTLLNQETRSDKIFWLDRIHKNTIENTFFDLIDHFVKYLNETCFTGITGYEFHYAMYEKGSFYKKHLDQFQNNSNRKYTMIFYLNENWIQGDGGELCVYKGNETENISPINGKCVFFKSSELAHEVLLSNVNRMSITGWLTA